MRIPSHLNGPPTSAHGGVASGMAARFVDPRAATVRLTSPPPLDTALTVTSEDGVVIVAGPAGEVAQVRPPVVADIDPLPRLSDAQLAAARDDWMTNAQPTHPFPTCYGCGHGRAADDGLRIYAGRVPETRLAAASWVPPADLSDDGHLVADWVVWAAVDCPSAGPWMLDLPEDRVMVLGQITMRIHDALQVGYPYQVVARARDRSGRRLESEVAVVDEAGRNVASGSATWIEVTHPSP